MEDQYNPVKHELCLHPDEFAFSSYHEWLSREDVNLQLLESVYAWNLFDLE